MKPFQSLFPELAQREVRCMILGPAEVPEPEPSLPADKYVFAEYYCTDLTCDCRQAFLQVLAEGQPGKIFASINVGWADEAFYRKRFGGDRELAAELVRGALDPTQEQSKYAGQIITLFQNGMKTTPYLLRLRRHYKMFREEVKRRDFLQKTNG